MKVGNAVQVGLQHLLQLTVENPEIYKANILSAQPIWNGFFARNRGVAATRYEICWITAILSGNNSFALPARFSGKVIPRSSATLEFRSKKQRFSDHLEVQFTCFLLAL
ncbi:MAG: hypothetical protein ACLU48_02490 [Clostridiaceae bacterium]